MDSHIVFSCLSKPCALLKAKRNHLALKYADPRVPLIHVNLQKDQAKKVFTSKCYSFNYRVFFFFLPDSLNWLERQIPRPNLKLTELESGGAAEKTELKHTPPGMLMCKNL